jgi:hypothetical protein
MEKRKRPAILPPAFSAFPQAPLLRSELTKIVE